MNRRGLSIRLIIGLVFAAVSLFSFLSKSQVNPVTGEKQRVSMTPEQEVAMGLQSAPEMAAQFGGLYQDQKVQDYVRSIGHKLVVNSEAANSPYQFNFHVLADDQTINAFALPGGQIFITVALLSQLDQSQVEDQVAGILGHEIGHVINRHSAEHMAKSDFTNGLVGAIGVAISDPGSPNGAAQIAQYVGNMVNMKYGREDELESDEFGLKYMVQAGYNPEALIGVMDVLAKAGGGGNRQSEFMSTHPYPENRAARIRELIAEYKKTGKFLR
jgi:predicted Zn-dependent protease